MASLLRKLAPAQMLGPGSQGSSPWASAAGAAMDYLGLGAAQSTLGNAAVGALTQDGASPAERTAGLIGGVGALSDEEPDLQTASSEPSQYIEESPPVEVMEQPCGILEEVFSLLESPALLESPLKRILEIQDPFAVPSMTCGDKDDDLTYAQIDVDAFTNDAGEVYKPTSPLGAWVTKVLEELGVLPEQEPEDITDYISPSDVRQGRLNDCYFNAAMMAVAGDNPQAIADAITDHGDGTYAVTLWMPDGPDGERVPTTVEVSNIFPVGASGVPQYSGHTTEPDATVPDLWPLLLEAAYAKIEGGYGEIEGGYSYQAMELITGEESNVHTFGTDDGLRPQEGLEFWDWFTFDRQADQGAVVADVRDDLSGDSGTQGEVVLASGDTLHGDHSYVVTSVDLQANQVILENPWGVDHEDGGDDRQVTVTLDEFEMYFYRIQHSPGPGETDPAQEGGEPIT